jgi:hypothetical protein
MSHPHTTSQRRPHTHTKRTRTRTQPATRSERTTATNRPRISHNRLFTACERFVSGISHPDRFRGERTIPAR